MIQAVSSDEYIGGDAEDWQGLGNGDRPDAPKGAKLNTPLKNPPIGYEQPEPDDEDDEEDYDDTDLLHNKAYCKLIDFSSALYSPFKEDTTIDLTGWDKQTLDYVNSNKRRILSAVYGIARASGRIVSKQDIDDIFQEIQITLYKSDDYNLQKATERSHTGIPLTLEAYVHNCVKNTVVRFLSERYKVEKCLVPEMKFESDSGKEISQFEFVEDENSTQQFEDLKYDLKAFCDNYEHARYKYGHDIFQLLYIRLLTSRNMDDPIFRNILTILGVSKKELASMERRAADDDIVINLLKAVSLAGRKKSISILGNYIYSANCIKMAIAQGT